jgi:hypothetical protein
MGPNSRTSIKINIDFGITPILECKTMFPSSLVSPPIVKK